MVKKNSRRHEGWKVTKRTVVKDPTGVGIERVERVRTAGILKKLSHAFVDEIDKMANGAEAAGGRTPSEEQVIKFLDKHPKPTDEQFHEWAESQGLNKHKAEQVAYKILSDIINKGESKGKVPSGVTPKMVAEGTKVEKEHTPNPLIARKITLDHQAEHAGYYPALKKMEQRLEKKAMGWGSVTKSLRGSMAMGKYVPKAQRVAGGGKRILSGGGMKTIVGSKAGESVTRPNLNIRTGQPKMKKVGAFFMAFVDELERKT